MDHLAQDLTLALEDSEPCGPANFKLNRCWGIKRRTRSAGNLNLCVSKSGDNHSDESSSSTNNEPRLSYHYSSNNKYNHHASFHQSDSDDMSLSFAIHNKATTTTSSSLRMKPPPPSSSSSYLNNDDVFKSKMKHLHYTLESDSLNENSSSMMVRPSAIRRKRKLKRMCVDEVTPVPPSGKRKRPQHNLCKVHASCKGTKLKPLQRSVLSKLEKICAQQTSATSASSNECVVNEEQEEEEEDQMETEDNGGDDDDDDVASESSLSWSGDEGHEGDDELTDWGGGASTSAGITFDSSSSSITAATTTYDCCLDGSDPREIRAGCRRLLHDRRPGFTIATGANERIARFLQDAARSELRLYGGEREKLGQLAALYSLDLWFDGTSSLLRKTSRTPCMQPTQRHHSGCVGGHKKIRTHDNNSVLRWHV